MRIRQPVIHDSYNRYCEIGRKYACQSLALDYCILIAAGTQSLLFCRLLCVALYAVAHIADCIKLALQLLLAIGCCTKRYLSCIALLPIGESLLRYTDI
jgi:hypothetical protein